MLNMKRAKLSKPDAQNIHAIRRARERYGAEITELDLRQICNKIRDDKSRYVGKLTNRVSGHLVEHKGQEFYVGYDAHTHRICSFLPMDSKELAL